jgi:hypothetical protein
MKSSNKESCSLFNHLQIHILFKNVQIQEGHLWVESIQVGLNFFLNTYEKTLFFMGLARFFFPGAGP